MTAPDKQPDKNPFVDPSSLGAVIYRPGDVVGESYVLLSELAKGGMGVVYKARHRHLDTIFALKLLPPVQTTTANWKRFEQEAKTLAKLEHKNIVQIFNMGVDNKGCPYYVMELLQGRSMAEALDESSPMTLPQFIQSFIDVCSALKLSHSKGIIHRDIKPSNLILLDSNKPVKVTKVVDFGIARLVGVDGQSQNLTLPGEIFGSPLYMSPEQTLGLPVSTASDIYSLGCTMFEAFTGSPPFKANTALATMMMHQTEDMPAIERDDCPDQDFDIIVDILAGCMEKQADKRFSSVDEILRLLDLVGPSKVQEDSTGNSFRSTTGGAASNAFSNSSSNTSENTFGNTGSQTTGYFAKRNRLAILLIIPAAVALTLVSLIALNLKKPVPFKKVSISSHLDRISPLPAFDTTYKTTQVNLNSTEPVSRVVSRHGKTWREFKFPLGGPVGYLAFDYKKKVPASGQIICDDLAPAYFDATHVLSNAPQFYERFDNGALRFILVKSSKFPPAISTLANWKNLTGLTFESCELQDSYVKGLQKLPHLRELSLNHGWFSRKALIESGVLPKLIKLDIYSSEDCSAILRTLEGSSLLERLGLRQAKLGEAELASIVTLTKLNSLDLRSAKLAPSTFTVLAKLPHLNRLQLYDVQYPGDLESELLKLKKLTLLEANSELLTPQFRARLKAASPGVEFTEE